MKKLMVLLLICVLLLAGCGGKNGEATLEKFNQIEVGMTYEEVCDIMGAEGELIAEGGSGDMVMQSYSWKGKKAGSSLHVSCTNGVVGAKAQSGLE